jgi:hypothetical protein
MRIRVMLSFALGGALGFAVGPAGCAPFRGQVVDEDSPAPPPDAGVLRRDAGAPNDAGHRDADGFAQPPLDAGTMCATMDPDACFVCCKTAHPKGFDAFDKGWSAAKSCACRTGAYCKDACHDSMCANWDPSSSCGRCMRDDGCWSKLDEAFATEPDTAQFDQCMRTCPDVGIF